MRRQDTRERKLREGFARLPEAHRPQFLSAFIHDMTVFMRSAYELEGADSAARLKAWNELLHRLSANLEAMLAGSVDRYPDDVLMQIVAAADDGLRQVVDVAFARALERAAVPAKGASAAE